MAEGKSIEQIALSYILQSNWEKEYNELGLDEQSVKEEYMGFTCSVHSDNTFMALIEDIAFLSDMFTESVLYSDANIECSADMANYLGYIIHKFIYMNDTYIHDIYLDYDSKEMLLFIITEQLYLMFPEILVSMKHHEIRLQRAEENLDRCFLYIRWALRYRKGGTKYYDRTKLLRSRDDFLLGLLIVKISYYDDKEFHYAIDNVVDEEQLKDNDDWYYRLVAPRYMEMVRDLS